MAAAAQVQTQPQGHKPLAFATRGVTGVIGLCAEASAYRKSKKAAKANGPVFDDSEPAIQLPSTELEVSPPSYNDLPDTEFQLQPLPKPVIIPQRRPKNAQRGFMRAYAPDLQTYKGIDEATFLKFLKDFHKESQASKSLKAMNVAGLAVGALNNPIAIGASFALVTTAQTSIQFQTRYRANVFLNKINEELFHPRNLHAAIMTFKPDAKSGEVVDVNVDSSDESLDKQVSRQQTLTGMERLSVQTTGRMAKFRTSNGYTEGEQALPEAAELVFPDEKYLAHSRTASSSEGSTSSALTSETSLSSVDSNPETKKRSGITRSQKFINSYYDRRAQAAFAGEHGANARLAVPGATDEAHFSSKYSDPNHPVNSGSFAALVSGGKHQSGRSLLHISSGKKNKNNNDAEVADIAIPIESDAFTEVEAIEAAQQKENDKKISEVEVASVISHTSSNSSGKKNKGEGKFTRTMKATMSWDHLYLMIVEWDGEQPTSAPVSPPPFKA